jgi:hypothetical protein
MVGREQSEFLRLLASGQEEEGQEVQRLSHLTFSPLPGKELRAPPMRATDKMAPLCVQGKLEEGVPQRVQEYQLSSLGDHI